MTVDQSQDPQREVQRLAAELARRERENDELKQELARTKNVQDDLWSHDILFKARRKMLGGVIVVLSVLSALGLVTVYELYQSGLDYVGDKMKQTVSALVQDEARRIIEKADKKMDERIAGLVAEKKKEINSLFDKTEKRIKAFFQTGEAQIVYSASIGGMK